MALERNFEDPRPYIEKADPDHPSLIDTKHRMAELYNVENVPTGFWIDENRNLVRPGDVVFGSDTFSMLTGIDAQQHKDAIRDWVKNDRVPDNITDEEIANRQTPSKHREDARAYYHLAQWFYEQDRPDAARTYFDKAIELAPDDVAIRRGSMRIRDENPMGLGFLKMVAERFWKGLDYYNPLP